MKKQDYDKIKSAIRYWLLGKEYYVALAAMDFGLKYHTGVRKDGVMQEFQHQISQANFARTLDSTLIYPEEVLATIFLHDVVEDIAEVQFDDVAVMLVQAGAEGEFLNRIMAGVEEMTNQYPETGVKKPKTEYYSAMGVVSSVCKGIDRIHNHQTMSDAFTIEKMGTYIKETEDHIIPMLKRARKSWNRQEAAYQNIKTVLNAQMEMVEVIIQAESS